MLLQESSPFLQKSDSANHELARDLGLLQEKYYCESHLQARIASSDSDRSIL